jgi:hypothetical protein
MVRQLPAEVRRLSRPETYPVNPSAKLRGLARLAANRVKRGL